MDPTSVTSATSTLIPIIQRLQVLSIAVQDVQVCAQQCRLFHHRLDSVITSLQQLTQIEREIIAASLMSLFELINDAVHLISQLSKRQYLIQLMRGLEQQQQLRD